MPTVHINATLHERFKISCLKQGYYMRVIIIKLIKEHIVKNDLLAFEKGNNCHGPQIRFHFEFSDPQTEADFKKFCVLKGINGKEFLVTVIKSYLKEPIEVKLKQPKTEPRKLVRFYLPANEFNLYHNICVKNKMSLSSYTSNLISKELSHPTIPKQAVRVKAQHIGESAVFIGINKALREQLKQHCHAYNTKMTTLIRQLAQRELSK